MIKSAYSFAVCSSCQNCSSQDFHESRYCEEYSWRLPWGEVNTEEWRSQKSVKLHEIMTICNRKLLEIASMHGISCSIETSYRTW
jgi:hypothetical protein